MLEPESDVVFPVSVNDPLGFAFDNRTASIKNQAKNLSMGVCIERERFCRSVQPYIDPLGRRLRSARDHNTTQGYGTHTEATARQHTVSPG